jgi:hypothetical protein
MVYGKGGWGLRLILIGLYSTLYKNFASVL